MGSLNTRRCAKRAVSGRGRNRTGYRRRFAVRDCDRTRQQSVEHGVDVLSDTEAEQTVAKAQPGIGNYTTSVRGEERTLRFQMAAPPCPSASAEYNYHRQPCRDLLSLSSPLDCEFTGSVARRTHDCPGQVLCGARVCGARKGKGEAGIWAINWMSPGRDVRQHIGPDVRNSAGLCTA